jgi:hypothetical protein
MKLGVLFFSFFLGFFFLACSALSTVVELLFQFISAILVAFAVFVHGSPVDHIVAFNFLPSVTPDQIDTVTERYLSLKDLCVDPATNQTYIVEFSGGRPNSREGFQQGMRLVFRMTLPNEYFRQDVEDEKEVRKNRCSLFFSGTILLDAQSRRHSTRFTTSSNSSSDPC